MLSDAAIAAGPIVGASRLAVNDPAPTTDYPKLSRLPTIVNTCSRLPTPVHLLATAPSFEAQPSRCRGSRGAPTARRTDAQRRW